MAATVVTVVVVAAVAVATAAIVAAGVAALADVVVNRIEQHSPLGHLLSAFLLV